MAKCNRYVPARVDIEEQALYNLFWKLFFSLFWRKYGQKPRSSYNCRRYERTCESPGLGTGRPAPDPICCPQYPFYPYGISLQHGRSDVHRPEDRLSRQRRHDRGLSPDLSLRSPDDPFQQRLLRQFQHQQRPGRKRQGSFLCGGRYPPPDCRGNTDCHAGPLFYALVRIFFRRH